MVTGLVTVGLIVLAFVGMGLAILNRIRRCPSDKILVIYGKTNGTESANCISGGTAFVWPVIQDYAYLPLKPITSNIDLTGALSSQQIPVNVPSNFTYGISKQPTLMQNAATRLLSLANVTGAIEGLASEIIFGQLRDVVAQLSVEELINNRESFLEKIQKSVETELNKVGLELINVNITDITDDSGYIKALGKKAAAEALNEARVEEAKKNKDGEIGVSNATREQRIEVAENHSKAEIGEKDAAKRKRIAIASADAEAIAGENTSNIEVANSNSERKVAEAEAQKKVTVATNVKEAEAKKDSYNAQKEAELARADAVEARQKAEIIVPARIEKEKMVIDSEAEAAKTKLEAQGEADAMYAKLEAQAKGEAELLNKRAEGFEKLVEAAGGDPNAAIQLLITEKLPELEKIRVDAIKNIKIDKVVVWDNGGNGGTNGTTDFIQSFMNAVPGYKEVFEMAGVEVPKMLEGSGESERAVIKAQEEDSDEEASEHPVEIVEDELK